MSVYSSVKASFEGGSSLLISSGKNKKCVHLIYQTLLTLYFKHMCVFAYTCLSMFYFSSPPPIKTVLKQSNPSEYSIGYVPINKLSQAAINMIDPLINS